MRLQICKDSSGRFGKACHQRFVGRFRWCELQTTPSEKMGLLMENRNVPADKPVETAQLWFHGTKYSIQRRQIT